MWQTFLSRMEIGFQYERIVAHGLQNTGNKGIRGMTRQLQNSGVGADYLMAMIHFKGFRSKVHVKSYKDTDD